MASSVCSALARAGAALCIFVATAAAASDSSTRSAPADAYRQPSEVTHAIVAARLWAPQTSVSRDGKWALVGRYAEGYTLADIVPERPQASRTAFDWHDGAATGSLQYMLDGYRLINLETMESVAAEAPGGGWTNIPTWSPDSRQFLATRYGTEGDELWIGDVSGRMRRINVTPNGANDRAAPCRWLNSGDRVVCRVVPKRTFKTSGDTIRGPTIMDSGVSGIKKRYDGFLSSTHDEELFDYYHKSQIALIDTRTLSVEPIGAPSVYIQADPSPDGAFLLVSEIVRPYSYDQFYLQFPRRVELWDLHGKLVRRFGSWPIDTSGDNLNGSTTPWPRFFQWIPSAPSSIAYLQAVDGGTAERKGPFRDSLMVLDARSRQPAREKFRTRDRIAPFAHLEYRTEYGTLAWLDYGRAWIEEYDLATEKRRSWVVDVLGRQPPRMAREYLTRQDGHAFLTTHDYLGVPYQLVQEGDDIFLSGSLAEDGLVEAFNVRTFKRRVLLRKKVPMESVRAVRPGRPGGALVLAAPEQSSPVLELKAFEGGARTLVSPAAQQRDLPMPNARNIAYQREDGVKLGGTLLLPPDYKPGSRLPLVVWSYPSDYPDAATAEKIIGVANRATGYTWASAGNPWFRAIPALSLRGYAVLVNAAMPILESEGSPPPEQQMVSSMAAAIDHLASQGIIDRSRVGIFGHSYGGAMVGTLLSHSKLFRAGIAVNGAYNLTNVPTFAQLQPRPYWSDPNRWLALSSLLHADKIEAPLLLIHGEKDGNWMTQPEEARRMFDALNSLGKTSRLVLLPYETHQPRSREAVLHVAWEMEQWFDKHLKLR